MNSQPTKDTCDIVMTDAAETIIEIKQENRSLRRQVADLQKALLAAQQLAVRQGHTIRKLQRGIV